MNKISIIISITALVLIDQLSKYFIYNLHFFENSYFVQPILNNGISWGIEIFSFNILIILIPLLLVGVFFLYKKNEIDTLTFILIFSGGLGNFIDRVYFHGVRDFIDFHFFPIFNIADVLISLGFFIISIKIIKNE